METYYHPHDLGKFAEMGKGNKDLWEKFMAYYSAVFAEGALTEREKALIALAVAHAVQCPYCIDAYTQASLEKAGPASSFIMTVHYALLGGSGSACASTCENLVPTIPVTLAMRSVTSCHSCGRRSCFSWG